MSDYKSPNDTESVSVLIAKDLTQEWLRRSETTRSTITRAMAQIQIAVRRESSPKRGMSTCSEILRSIEKPQHIAVTRELKHARFLSFEVTFMGGVKRSVIVSRLAGTINWRTKSVLLREGASARLSLHSIARLISRLKDPSGEQLVTEIASGLHGADSWLAAGRKVGASCWPLPTRHGVLVAADGLDGAETNIITWLAESGISAKWRAPLQALRYLIAHRPEALKRENFKTAFIRAYPFMLHEHQKEDNLEDIASAQEGFYQPNTEDDLLESESVGADLRLERHRPRTNVTDPYLIGNNYTEFPADLKRYERHKGAVITKDPGGMLVVGLENGLIGKIPASLATMGRELIPRYVMPGPGDMIEVVITNFKRHYENASFVLILEPFDVFETMWERAKDQFRIGSKVKGTLLRAAAGFLVHIDRRIKGRFTDSLNLDYVTYLKLLRANECRLELEFRLSGFDDFNYLFVFEDIYGLDQYTKLIDYPDIKGDILSGKCTRVDGNYALVTLPGSATGVLHVTDTWGHDLPGVDDEVQVRAYDIDVSGGKINLELLPPGGLEVKYLRSSNRSVTAAKFYEAHTVGDMVNVQVRGFAAYNSSIVVCTEDGVAGAVHWKESSWLADSAEEVSSNLVIGQIRSAVITKIKFDKKLLILSFKQLLPNPTELHLKELIIGGIYNGLIKKCVDFGYFVRLSENPVEGLMHKSDTPATLRKLEKGERIWVRVKSIDYELKRIAVSFESLIDQP